MIESARKRQKHLNEAWNTFRLLVIPADAPGWQLREMRRAFFAGAETLKVTMLRNVSNEAEMTDGDMNLMDDLDAELNEFAADVVKGLV